MAEIGRRYSEGIALKDMAGLYCFNALSRDSEEALMRSKISYVLLGDVGFYQRAEVKDDLALLRLATKREDRQSDEAFRRVRNVPARGLSPKAQEMIKTEGGWRSVSLLRAIKTAPLTAKVRSQALTFADAVRVGARATLTLADQLSLLLDQSGYRAMLWEVVPRTPRG